MPKMTQIIDTVCDISAYVSFGDLPYIYGVCHIPYIYVYPIQYMIYVKIIHFAKILQKLSHLILRNNYEKLLHPFWN